MQYLQGGARQLTINSKKRDFHGVCDDTFLAQAVSKIIRAVKASTAQGVVILQAEVIDTGAVVPNDAGPLTFVGSLCQEIQKTFERTTTLRRKVIHSVGVGIFG